MSAPVSAPADSAKARALGEDKGAERDLGGRAARGAGWSMLGYGGGQVLRFAGNLILTRLLFEEAFGLMALVNVFLQGLQLFSDIGIGPAIIQNPRGDEPRFLNTAWTIQVGRGFALWVVACLGGYPFALFYDEPILAWMIPVAALSALGAGFNSTKLFTLNRHLNLKRLVVVDIGSQCVGLVTMVVWVLISPTVWALVAGGTVGPLTKMVLSHLALPGPNNRPAWDKTSAQALFSFGRWIFFSTALTFLSTQSDRLVFGKLIPMDMLGVYSIGLMISTLPAMAISHLASSIAFPLYCRVVGAGQQLSEVFRRIRYPFLLLGGWALSGLCGGGQAAIDLLYDDRYAQAGWMVQLLAVMAWLAILEATNGSGLLARGRAQWVAAASLGKLVGMLAFIPLGHHYAGFPGAVAGFVAAEGFKYAVSAYAAAKEGLVGFPGDIGLSVFGAVAAFVGWLSASAVKDAGLHPVFACAAVFLSVSAVWAVLIGPFLHRIRTQGNPLRVDVP